MFQNVYFCSSIKIMRWFFFVSIVLSFSFITNEYTRIDLIPFKIVPKYAKMNAYYFEIGDLIQHEVEFRFGLGPHFATDLQKSGIHKEDTLRYKHFLALIDFIKSHPNIIFELGSHTDYRGRPKSNIELSQRRANAIVTAMREGYGIDATQLIPRGYGRENPRTVFMCDGEYFQYPDDSLVSSCKKNAIPVVLTNEYINLCKTNKVLFEHLHQLNRRTEVKVIGFRN